MRNLILLVTFYSVTSLAHSGMGDYLFRDNNCFTSKAEASMSLEEQLELVRERLSGSEMRKFAASCGEFVAGNKYYQGLMTPKAEETIEEIRQIRDFKNIANRLLKTLSVDNPYYLDIINLNSLWNSDDQVALKLIRLTYSQDRDVRLVASGALQGTKSQVAIAKLLEMLESSDELVQYQAARALSGTTDPAAKRALKNVDFLF